MHTRALLFAVSILSACGSRSGDDTDRRSPPNDPAQSKPPAGGGEPAGKETRVIEVADSNGLLALYSAYQMLWDSGFDGTLEVRFADAAYPAQGWSLEPASDSDKKGARATIDVVLRGAPASPPAPSRIRARSLVVEDMIFAAHGSPWELRVADSFVMKRSMIVDGRGPTWENGPAHLAILGESEHGARKATPVTARIESSWFVRNWQGDSPFTMLGFGSVDLAPTYWDSIEIHDCVFAGNAFATRIRFQHVKAARITRSLFYETWPSGVVFDSVGSASIVIDDSVIVAEGADNVASHGAESPPVILGEGTRVYVNGWTATSAVPPAVVAEPARFADRAAIAGGDATLAKAGQLPADAIPPADLKAALDAAARP